tara:strand:+ start:1106 stop:1906 length:801 start_codon:yes stop_codon:yes gene_type:complete
MSTVTSRVNAKFNADSVSVSFSRSGLEQCADSGSYFGADGGCDVRPICYSTTMESRFPGLDRKLERHEQMGFQVVCEQATRELKDLAGSHVSWFRFSTHGSFPERRLSLRELIALMKLCKAIVGHVNPNGTSVKVHCPIEGRPKAEYYAPIFARFDIVVRASIDNQSFVDGDLLQFVDDPTCSTVADVPVGPQRIKRRLQQAFALARSRRISNGTKVYVCPHESYSLKTKTAKKDMPSTLKCGIDIDGKGCDLCSRNDIDGIVFIA